MGRAMSIWAKLLEKAVQIQRKMGRAMTIWAKLLEKAVKTQRDVTGEMTIQIGLPKGCTNAEIHSGRCDGRDDDADRTAKKL